MIKEVKVKTNVVIVNKHHEQGYENKEGVMIIEKDNGMISCKSELDKGTEFVIKYMK